MGSVSTAKKLVLAARVVQEQIGRSRVAGALFSGFKATAVSVGNVLHVLWLEVTGFIFLTLGVIGAAAGVREFYKAPGGGPNLNKVYAAGLFAALFAYFGITSFWRARKKRA